VAPATVAAAPGPAARAVAAHTWTAVRGPHVEVLTDAGREVGERVASRLEAERSVLRAWLPQLVADVAPVQVIVFRDSALAATYAPTWRGVRDDVAGWFQASPDRRRLLFVDDGGRTPSVAQHEYAHALSDATLPDLPLWFHEGLAEFLSTFRVESGRARIGEPVPAHVSWLALHPALRASDLFDVDAESPDYHEGDRRGTFYAQSWALVRALLAGDPADVDRLARVLEAARDGEDFGHAFRREVGDAESRWTSGARGTSRVLEAALPTGVTPALQVRLRVPAAEVLATLGIAMLVRRTPAFALDSAEPEACAGMGWLESHRGHAAAARSWFDRVLASPRRSDPARRLVASATLLQQDGQRDPGARREAAAYARRALERGDRVLVDDPEFAALLARTWVVWPGDDAERGYAFSVRATSALPGRADLQLDRLALAAHTGRRAEAEAIAARRFGPGATAERRSAAHASLLASAIHDANRLMTAGLADSAVARVQVERGRLADDPELAAKADRALAELAANRDRQREVARENLALERYNAGVTAANAHQPLEAAQAFRDAAERSARPAFRDEALRMARRMDMRALMDRAVDRARAGDRAGALALLEQVDASVLDVEDRRWLESQRARLRSGGR
jgi:hypothetical protein